MKKLLLIVLLVAGVVSVYFYNEKYNSKKIRAEIKEIQGSINYCSVDNDCVVLRGGSLCGYTFGNKNTSSSTIDRLDNLINKYRDLTNIAVDCALAPEELSCINNKCVIKK